MNKLRIITAALTIGAAFMAGATQIIVGSYNIRVKTADDKGVNSWDARKSYVARTVTDNGFDVVGFNEVKSGQQKTDLVSMLDNEYSFFGWDGHEGFESTAETAVDLVAWRTDKFDCLDSGWFFLCRDLGTGMWEQSWDNSSFENVRHTSWVKLQVTGTDEVFYVFCTHLDHQGNIARMLQSHMNYEKMWEIAGHYPTIMVGDQNSTTSRVNYLNLYKAGLTDAFSTVDDPTAKFGSADPATAGQWKEDTSTGRRIDYIWVRGFNVDDYDHCTDTYDLGAMPSDHIAIKAKLTYQDPDINNRYTYVAPGGTGDGSKSAPFGSIQDAVNAAGIGDTIYVAKGSYDVTAQINVAKTVRLFGGYDKDFNEVTGLSEVKAAANVRCIDLKAATDVEMRNFAVRNGTLTSTTADGAGIRAHGARLIMRECELSDNSAGRDGGGIDCTGQLILDHVRFLNNKAGHNGGAVCCDNPSKRYWFNFPVTDCYFDGNEAPQGAAIYLPRFVYCHVAGNTFVNNKASEGTPVYLHAVGTDNNLGANLYVFNNTFALNSSAGAGNPSAMFVEIEPVGSFSLVNNTIVSNSSDSNVAAVYMQSGTPCVGNNIIACNEGGDVFLNTDAVLASYNLYTTSGTINYPVNAKDIYTADAAAAATALADVLDGTVTDGKFVPSLSLPEGDAAMFASDNATVDFTVPSVKVVNPVHAAGKNLNSVTALRLRESIVRADFNFDCMQESSVYLPADQAGVARPTNGKATMGAREYVEGAGIFDVPATSGAADADAPVEYFDLQGRRVSNPSRGIYIRRQGATAEKVIIL